MLQVDAWKALTRHAVMTEEVESRKPPPVPVKRRSPAAPRMPAISHESRAQYDYEFTERVGIKMDAGMAEAGAECEALEELGCVEFWDCVNAAQRGTKPLRKAA